ncbi:MAG: exonuclease SbcCD subunit D C-terminal domain-containing protein [Aliarcobacter sp.]|nr:exonuclease SbcCD subunit D C-terminal domain-containing protein [Aliarcobacter sp.]MDD2887769.1 exonuclease SbcCD subunit D C-terminal domain-containing protein [Aliarcobacter sp.]
MKILHTSDWHLGQNFMGKSRLEEHEAFLSWLLKIIKEKQIEVPLSRKLIVIKGNYETIKNELTKIEDKNSWIEVHISDDNAMYENNEIRQLASKLELTLLAVKIDKSEKQLKANELKVISLDELSVEQVFEKRLELEELEDKEFEKELLLNFKELVSKVQSL